MWHKQMSSLFWMIFLVQFSPKCKNFLQTLTANISITFMYFVFPFIIEDLYKLGIVQPKSKKKKYIFCFIFLLTNISSSSSLKTSRMVRLALTSPRCWRPPTVKEQMLSYGTLLRRLHRKLWILWMCPSSLWLSIKCFSTSETLCSLSIRYSAFQKYIWMFFCLGTINFAYSVTSKYVVRFFWNNNLKSQGVL